MAQNNEAGEGIAARGGGSRLAAAFAAGHFALTSETTPPASADPAHVLEKVMPLRGLADAVNVTDGAGARVRASVLAVSAILAQNGIDPILQLTVRDRNRLALQGKLLGGAMVGAVGMLALTGDSVEHGDEPEAKPVFDTDSAALMRMLRTMRDEGKLPSGRELKAPPKLLIGAADLPREPQPGFSPDALKAKIGSGADFVQTQYAFDLDLLRRYMKFLMDEGLAQQTNFLIGIGPIASAKSARWMDANLFGVHIPEPIIKRIEGAKDEREEGKKICIELLQELTEIPGVAGAHLMAPNQEAACAELIAESGLLEARKTAA